MNNIFVGNLSFISTKEDVVKLFEPFGSVTNVVIMEGKKGKSRGFGFVLMPNEEEKNAAIAALDGKEFMWRVLSVNPVMPKMPGEARPKKAKQFKSTPSSRPSSRPISKPTHTTKPPYKKPEGQSKWKGGSKAFSKTGSGFKMLHKVSGVAKSRPRKVKAKIYFKQKDSNILPLQE